MNKRNVIILLSLSLFGAVAIYLLSPLPQYEQPPPLNPKKDLRLRQEALLQHSFGQSDSKPNIIIILAEGISRSQLSCYGNQLVFTPNIDKIAQKGVRFTNAYSPAFAEAPASVAVLTGQSPQSLGYELNPKDNYPNSLLEYWYYHYWGNNTHWQILESGSYPSPEAQARQALALSQSTLAEILKANQYRSAIIGEWRLGYAHQSLRPRQRGFDYQYGSYTSTNPRRLNDEQSTEGQALRKQGRKITASNTPLQACFAEAETFIQNHQQKPFMLYLAVPDAQNEKKHFLEQLTHIKDPERRAYYAKIKALDAAVGTFLKHLETLKLNRQTLLIFAGSNGGLALKAGDNAPLKGGKYTPFEGGINVPLLMQWEGSLPRGLVYQNLVSLSDIFSTAFAAAHGRSQLDYDGVNLLPFLRGNDNKAPHYALFWRSVQTRAVRKGDWKLIIAGKQQDTLLYNLKSDESETQNLARRYETVTAELLKELKEWEAKLPSKILWQPWRSYRFYEDEEKYYDFAF